MANSNRPNGLSPVKHANGADWDGKVTNVFIHSSNTDIIRVGDCVTKNTTLAQVSTEGLLSVKLGASTNIFAGVVVAVGRNLGGPYVDPANLDRNFAPATKLGHYYAAICSDPNVIYEVQEESVASQMTGAHVGCNQILVVAAPTQGTLSGWQVAGVTTGTPAATTFDVKLLGLSQRYDQGAKNTYGAYAKWLVMLTQPALGTVAGFAASA